MEQRRSSDYSFQRASENTGLKMVGNKNKIKEFR